MGRSKRRRGYSGSNNQNNGGKFNKLQVTPADSSKQPKSIFCAVCEKAYDDGFPIWELPRGKDFNVMVRIPACDYCRDSEHFRNFLAVEDDEIKPKTISDYLRLIALYLENYQKRRTF